MTVTNESETSPEFGDSAPRSLTMSPRWIKCTRWSQLLRSLFLLLILLFAYQALRRFLGGPEIIAQTLAVAFGLFGSARILLAFLMPVWEWRRCRYVFHEDRIVIERGVFQRRVQTIPRSRIQHIELSQGPIERHYDLSQLNLNTAGTVHARISLPGLPSETARRLRDELVEDATDERA